MATTTTGAGATATATSANTTTATAAAAHVQAPAERRLRTPKPDKLAAAIEDLNTYASELQGKDASDLMQRLVEFGKRVRELTRTHAGLLGDQRVARATLLLYCEAELSFGAGKGMDKLRADWALGPLAFLTTFGTENLTSKRFWAALKKLHGVFGADWTQARQAVTAARRARQASNIKGAKKTAEVCPSDVEKAAANNGGLGREPLTAADHRQPNGIKERGRSEEGDSPAPLEQRQAEAADGGDVALPEPAPAQDEQSILELEQGRGAFDIPSSPSVESNFEGNMTPTPRSLSFKPRNASSPNPKSAPSNEALLVELANHHNDGDEDTMHFNHSQEEAKPRLTTTPSRPSASPQPRSNRGEKRSRPSETLDHTLFSDSIIHDDFHVAGTNAFVKRLRSASKHVLGTRTKFPPLPDPRPRLNEASLVALSPSPTAAKLVKSIQAPSTNMRDVQAPFAPRTWLPHRSVWQVLHAITDQNHVLDVHDWMDLPLVDLNARTTPTTSATIPRFKSDDFTLAPAVVNGNHWILLLFEPSSHDRRITFFNTLTSSTTTNRVKRVALAVVAANCPSGEDTAAWMDSWSFVEDVYTQVNLQQSNTWDCGIYVLALCLHLCVSRRDRPISIPGPYWRALLACLAARGAVMRGDIEIDGDRDAIGSAGLLVSTRLHDLKVASEVFATFSETELSQARSVMQPTHHLLALVRVRLNTALLARTAESEVLAEEEEARSAALAIYRSTSEVVRERLVQEHMKGIAAFEVRKNRLGKDKKALEERIEAVGSAMDLVMLVAVA